jgi:hypothetical protein
LIQGGESGLAVTGEPKQALGMEESEKRQPYAAPCLSVIGTFHELTTMKGSTSNDGGGGGHKSV